MPRRTLPEPRSWLHKRAQHEFGRGDLPDNAWRSVRGPVDHALLDAARNQHEFMSTVRAASKANRSVTTQQLAALLGVSIDQLRRLKRGEAHLLLADMHCLAARLGLTIHMGLASPKHPQVRDGDNW